MPPGWQDDQESIQVLPPYTVDIPPSTVVNAFSETQARKLEASLGSDINDVRVARLSRTARQMVDTVYNERTLRLQMNPDKSMSVYVSSDCPHPGTDLSMGKQAIFVAFLATIDCQSGL